MRICMPCDLSPSQKAVYFYIHIPGPLAAIFISPMAISVLTASLSVLISVTLLVSHASVSVIKTQTRYNIFLGFFLYFNKTDKLKLSFAENKTKIKTPKDKYEEYAKV